MITNVILWIKTDVFGISLYYNTVFEGFPHPLLDGVVDDSSTQSLL